MKATIQPGFRQGEAIHIPASKSISHRVLISAALANGESVLEGVVDNDDTKATISCLKQLGAQFDTQGDKIIVKGIPNWKSFDERIVDCNESGSTLRFMIPLFSLTGKNVTFTGRGRLMERPQSVYDQIFSQRRLKFIHKNGQIQIKGKLTSGIYPVAGNISSQFITGLLFTLPLLDGDSVISITPPYESKSYVGLTEDVLEKAGVQFKDTGNMIMIPGGQKYQPIHDHVEGDDSQLAFFACGAVMNHVPITVLNVSHTSRQGDHQIIEFVKNAGGNVIEVEGGYRFEPGELKGTEIDLQNCPDLGPILFAMATQCEGTTVFKNAGRLRIKESDRIACMEEELRKLGCTIYSEGGTVTVMGKSKITGGVTLNGHNDHRIVMALSMLSALADAPVTIFGAEAVNKSYPDFFQDFVKAGGNVEVSL